MDFKHKIFIVTMLIICWGLCSPILGTRNNPQHPHLKTKVSDLGKPSSSLLQCSASGDTQDPVFIDIPEKSADSSQDHVVIDIPDELAESSRDLVGIDIPEELAESSRDHVIIDIPEELAESSRDHVIIDIPEELAESSRDHVIIDIPEELAESSRDHVIIDIPEELVESSQDHFIIDISEELAESSGLETLQLEEQSNYVDSAPGTTQSSHSGFLSAATTLMFATLLLSGLFRCLLSTRSAAIPIRNMRLQQMRQPRRRPAKTRKHDHFKTT